MTPTALLSFSWRTSARCLTLAVLLSLSACLSLPTRTACPSAQDMSSQMLYGRWTAQIEGEPAWSLTLGPHPEHVGSLRGELTRTLNQHTQRRAVVADLDDGEFTLEETHDGQRIAATWQGQFPNEGCGRQIQGHRSMTGQSSRPFLITRQP